MRAITIPEFGGPEALVPADVPAPTPGPGEVLIEVVAAGVNRADVMQRKGFYSPPEGESEVPGLEVSGRIAALGDDVTGWSVGEQVCALLTGGGYAEQAVAPVGQVLPVPEGVDLADAAALPEVVSTVWSNVFLTANLQPGQVLLVHGGSSGIGTMAIQLARQVGARVAVTAGSADKLAACQALGAEILINYREQDFVEEIKTATDGAGADVILDVVGAKYLDRNLDALALGGRLVVIGMQGGRKGELDLGKLLGKRGAVIATSLRARPRAEKATIVAAVREHVWPLIEAGQVTPVIHQRFPLDRAADAHRLMEESTHIGKILLDVSTTSTDKGPGMSEQTPAQDGHTDTEQDQASPTADVASSDAATTEAATDAASSDDTADAASSDDTTDETSGASETHETDETPEQRRVVVVTQDGMGVAQPGPTGSGNAPDQPERRKPSELVEHPAKVMRVGTMIKQLLEEVKSAPLDEAGRARLAEIHRRSLTELEQGLAPELVEELERITLPLSDETPTEAELRIAQAQLVGWLEGLFHGIQTAIMAQQMAAQQQLQQIRVGLPGGTQAAPGHGPVPGKPVGPPAEGDEESTGTGQYL